MGGRVVGVVMNDIESAIYATDLQQSYGYRYKYEEALPSQHSPGFLTRLKRGFGLREPRGP
jgi:hypothetical protein